MQNIFNKKIYFTFCPERTIEGAALKELSLNPQIVGSEDPYAKKIVNNFPYITFVGKTNKGNLVFENKNKQLKVSPKGNIL